MTDPAATPVVRTTAGQVRGVRIDGSPGSDPVVRFRSVPYAAPPEGPLRFVAPAPVPGWDGVREAGGGVGPNAPQPVRQVAGGLDMSPVIGTGWRPGPDYLTADVWTPDPGAGGLPVMVFLHGGAFVAGEGSAGVYDGEAFARSGVVLVSVNYRLGAEGFLPVPGGDTNVGLRDQLAALAWVRDNAAAFGGDPDLVTVFGESAGAMSIGLLLGSPLSEGLFRRAILESGGAEMARAGADRVAPVLDRIAADLGVTADADGLRGVAVADLAAAQGRVDTPGQRPDLREPDGTEPGFGITGFLPVLGDDVFPRSPLDALRDGASARVDVLAGSNAEEMNLYLAPTGLLDALTEDQARTALGVLRPDAGTLMDGAGAGTAGERYARVLTELVFTGPTRRVLQAHTGASFGYEFAWRSPACDGRLGACHALELPFVFGTLDRAAAPDGLPGETPPAELSTRMHRAWVDFAATGDPGWPARDGADPHLMRFDGDADTLVAEPTPPVI
ncbi:carboxylesterase/lipase family protein [Pseudonocardia sp. KRD291]|uniref:carboxylesterase/lipase family protein n=1 Tax=Pseudonocardia sp. KRD291 TaxID=2792007 RepID=UPI001C4A0053|nr:carboxylesterase family protein [Pseudonocardia sp. KRD291]MBW0103776.1 carboxylesterase family protein [Pseudonocardia sp. KRD291]